MKLTLQIQRFRLARFTSIFMAIFILFSCEREDFKFDEVEKARSFKVETLTHQEASSNPRLLSSFQETKVILEPLQAKSGVFHDTLNDMYILTDQVKHITTGEYESFTYGIQKNVGSNNLYNLLFSKQVDGSFKSVLVTYDLSKVTLEQLNGGNLDIIDPDYVSFNDIGSTFSMKNDIITVTGEGDCVTITMSEGDCGYGGHHVVGEYCPTLETIIQETTRVWAIERESCGSNEGGGGPNSDSDPSDPFVGDNGYPDTSGNPTNGSGANTDGSNSSNDTNDDTPEDCLYDSNNQCIGQVTSPVLPRLPLIVSPLTQDLFETLEDEEKNYINHPDQNQLRRQIDDFLLEEEHSEPANGFARDAIKAKMEDEDTEVDYDEKIIENLSGRTKEIYTILKASDPFFAEKLVRDNFESGKESLLALSMTNFASSIHESIPALADLRYNSANGNFRLHSILIDQNRIQTFTNLEVAQIIVHEFLHAELMERSIQLGLFTRVEASRKIFEPLPGNITLGPTQLNDVIFAYMLDNYRATPSTSSDWNHNAFSIENYRGRIVDAMLSVHPFLTDPSPTSAFPPPSLSQMTLREIFEDFSWNGLKETAEHLALDQSIKDRIEFVTDEINRTYSRTL